MASLQGSSLDDWNLPKSTVSPAYMDNIAYSSAREKNNYFETTKMTHENTMGHKSRRVSGPKNDRSFSTPIFSFGTENLIFPTDGSHSTYFPHFLKKKCKPNSAETERLTEEHFPRLDLVMALDLKWKTAALLSPTRLRHGSLVMGRQLAVDRGMKPLTSHISGISSHVFGDGHQSISMNSSENRSSMPSQSGI